MWRSIIVYNGERLSVKDNWIVIYAEDGSSKSVPIEDLYCIVIDNQDLSLSVYAIAELAKKNVHVVITDERHLPISQIYPLNTNYHCYHVLKKQLEMTNKFKGELWKRIVVSKIVNQAICLTNIGSSEKVIGRLMELSTEVQEHDSGNREAITAKMFFRTAYGSNFVRFNDDCINASLNYGYAIIRSCVAKSLVAHGFNCVLGIHHISETNEFNLADDLMEPFRAIVDEWVVKNLELVEEGLSKTNKGQLVELINKEIIFANKKMKLRYAIDSMIKSFVTAIETNNSEQLILPVVVKCHEK